MWAAARRLCGPGAGLLLLRGRGEAALPPARTRSLHGSAVACGSKNLLKKFASKTRKKFWYEGPSLGSNLVSLTPDCSACRVYWKASLSADQNERTDAALQRSAAHMRHLLMSQQTLRNAPPIVFIQDRKNAALAEVDRLLAVADFGPVDGGDHPSRDYPRDPDALSPHDPPGPAAHSSLCGIDHEALNKQIMEYKRRKEKGLLSLALLGQEQGAEPTQPVRRRKALPCQGQDGSPRSSLLGEGYLRLWTGFRQAKSLSLVLNSLLQPQGDDLFYLRQSRRHKGHLISYVFVHFEQQNYQQEMQKCAKCSAQTVENTIFCNMS
ncbi:putative ribosome-binding factor A, mitochondrial isoform X3 [Sciurus carolinensis]|uniref:putative ribosome-binding factor A, mitochondrial isoform X3 n=1 Tax=Sciurus carolinensis TaxID=30640 RepID=UPI001FB3AA81|nr:putative ribosome-binding factor A, mitochondrial isoform X3 [Sciurus carolinensis]